MVPPSKSGTKQCDQKSTSLPRVGDYTSPCNDSSVYRDPESCRLGRAARGELMSEVQMKNQESCKVSHVLAVGGGKAVAIGHAT
jgi:hypothetical protein